MTFNLMFFAAFFGLAYLVNRLGETIGRSHRIAPVRIRSSAARRPPGDSAP